MTWEHYQQWQTAMRNHIAKRQAERRMAGGKGVIVNGRMITLEPAPAAAPRTQRTIMLHIWARVTMTQSMSDVVALPPEYDQSGTYAYPLFLVASLPLSQAVSGYTWEVSQQVLPEAGPEADAAGELQQGVLWSGDYYEGTAPNYEIEIGDLQKTAVVTLYLRGRFVEDANYQLDFDDPASFENDFAVGTRTLGTLLEGNRASPLPNMTEVGEFRVGYGGTTFNLEALPRGAYPNASVRSIFSVTSISRN